jgi:hypothetical protein
MIIYTIIEQHPNRPIVSCKNLKDADSILNDIKGRLALPIIISGKVCGFCRVAPCKGLQHHYISGSTIGY